MHPLLLLPALLLSLMMNMPKRICVLMSETEGCDYEDDDCDADVEGHLRRAGLDDIDVEVVKLTPHNYGRALVGLAQRFEKKEVDCFLNLCDGAWDEPSVGISVVDLLENKLNLPFTGAGTGFFEPTRNQMKQVALACGVLVPAWRFVYNVHDMQKLLHDMKHDPPLKFPLLVKHFSSYASVGLTKESKVWSVGDLEKQCVRMLDTYNGCLVEEFIQGREFTVLAAQEPDGADGIKVVAYEPVECHFGEGEDFKHYNLKWVDYDNIGWRHVGAQNPELAERLKALARDVFKGIGGRGYGRIDVRSDESGKKLYFLEINPNCGIFYPPGQYGSADFILDRLDPKMAHASFIVNQTEVARRLWLERNSRACEAHYDTIRGSWGMYATKNLDVGDVIIDLEEKPMYLVSKQHVLQHWKREESVGDFDMKNWANFAAYCWPVADDLFAMWAPEPSEWRPINHHCDPNAWLAAGNGLNVVARKPIRVGEEICMDYASFTGYFPDMKTFDCNCTAKDCRKQITGLDILNLDVARKYYGHMSSYVASKATEIHGGKVNGVNGKVNGVKNGIKNTVV